MTPRPSAGELLSAQTGSELRALVLRLESLHAELASNGLADDRLRVELAAALSDIEETWSQVETYVADFEAGMDRERALYRDLFDRAPDAYVVTDEVGKILDANNAAAALFGKLPMHVVGKPLPIFVTADDRREFRRALLALGHETYLDFEVRFDSEWGVRDIEVRALRAREERTSRVFVRWILRDITERSRAEEEIKSLNAELEMRIAERTRELTETSARLEIALRELPEGVIIVDTDGRLMLANRRAEELLGSTFEELRRGPLAETWDISTPQGTPVTRSDWLSHQGVVTG